MRSGQNRKTATVFGNSGGSSRGSLSLKRGSGIDVQEVRERFSRPFFSFSTPAFVRSKPVQHAQLIGAESQIGNASFGSEPLRRVPMAIYTEFGTSACCLVHVPDRVGHDGSVSVRVRFGCSNVTHPHRPVVPSGSTESSRPANHPLRVARATAMRRARSAGVACRRR